MTDSLYDQIEKQLNNKYPKRLFGIFVLILCAIGIFAIVQRNNVINIKERCVQEKLNYIECNTVVRLMKHGNSWNIDAMSFEESLLVIKK